MSQITKLIIVNLVLWPAAAAIFYFSWRYL